MKEISTEIEINASRDRVWEVLTDFDAYPEWNPVIERVTGELRVGEQLEMVVHPFGPRTVTIRPVVLKADPGRELRWRARLTTPGLFEGEHSFVIEQNGDRGVRIIHTERFRGGLVPLVSALLENHTRRGFEEMNRALKARAENVDTQGARRQCSERYERKAIPGADDGSSAQG